MKKRSRSLPILMALVASLLALALRDAAAANAQYSLDLVGIKSGTAYTVVVDVGTAASGAKNSFRLIADTGSSNDAVLGSTCCGGQAQVSFDCSASSSCQAGSTQISLAFAGAKIAGRFVTDKWSSKQIGSITKPFVVIEQEDGFYRNEYDGITGLGYSALAQPKGSPKPSFYDSLIASKSGTPDAFGMLMCGVMQPLLLPTVSPNFSLHAGQLVVGGREGPQGEALYTAPMLFTPIAQEAWYVVIVSDIGFDGKSLGLPCAKYNQPQAIIDSGTSNIAFPSDVYNVLMDRIKAATKKAVPGFDESYLDYRKSCCGQDYCSPSDAKAALLSLPSIYITLALQDNEDSLQGTSSHFTIEIPPEYYFRPEMNGKNSDLPCRAIGVAEGSAIVLGSVLMDGLYTYHDRTGKKMGIAVAKDCPNGVTSTKKIYKADNQKIDWCDCFSDKLKSKSLLATYAPWGKHCFFMPWWMYVVIGSVIVVVICIGIIAYWAWTGRRDKLKAMAAENRGSITPNAQSAHANRAYGAAAPSSNASTVMPSRDVSSETHMQPPQPQAQPPHPQHRPAPAHDNYNAVESPRELLDSKGSSIALLTSADSMDTPPARTTAAPTFSSSTAPTQPPSSRVGSRRQGPLSHASSSSSTSSFQPDRDSQGGFLL
ncbi:hypothetical protein ATCC90586_003521 [Pythium insidiosum]|nr:hypothetical protein ATCC90586_003521 [Pythium insidiosum]